MANFEITLSGSGAQGPRGPRGLGEIDIESVEFDTDSRTLTITTTDNSYSVVIPGGSSNGTDTTYTIEWDEDSRKFVLVGSDGSRDSETISKYDDSEIQARVDSEALVREAADADLQAQINALPDSDTTYTFAQTDNTLNITGGQTFSYTPVFEDSDTVITDVSFADATRTLSITDSRGMTFTADIPAAKDTDTDLQITDFAFNKDTRVLTLTTSTETHTVTIPDSDTTYTNGYALRLTGTEFSVDTEVIKPEETVSVLVESVAGLLQLRETQRDGEVLTQTAFRAGDGLLIDTDISHTLSVDTDVIADTEWVKALPVSTFSNDSGYITKDSDTTYTSGYGLKLNDTEFSVDTDVIADTEWVKDLPVSTFNNDAGYLTKDSDTTYTFTSGTNGSFTVTPSNGTAQIVQTGGSGGDAINLDAGFGIVTSSLVNDSEIVVDTDVIADTEWVKDQGYITSDKYVTSGSVSGTTLTLNRNDTDAVTITGLPSGGGDSVTAGYGINVDSSTVSVDTEVIADTEWVREIGVHTSRYLKITTDTVPMGASLEGSASIAMGEDVSVSGNNNIAIGSEITIDSEIHNIAIGRAITMSDAAGIAIGDGTRVTDTNGIAFGQNSRANHSSSIAIGTNAVTSANNQMMIGGDNPQSGITAVRIRYGAYNPTDSLDLVHKGYVDNSSHISGIFDGEDTEFLASGTWAKPAGITQFAAILVPGGIVNSNSSMATSKTIFLFTNQPSHDTDYNIVVGAGTTGTGISNSWSAIDNSRSGHAEIGSQGAAAGYTFSDSEENISVFSFVKYTLAAGAGGGDKRVPFVASDGSQRGVINRDTTQTPTNGAVVIYWPSTS